MALITGITELWQDWAVYAIGIVVAGVLVGRIVRLFRKRAGGSCASCNSAGCPMVGSRRRIRNRRTDRRA